MAIQRTNAYISGGLGQMEGDHAKIIHVFHGNLTLNFCQGPLPETHSSQNQFVNAKRNQLHLEVTWLVPLHRSFRLFSDIFQIKIQVRCSMMFPNPPLGYHWSSTAAAVMQIFFARSTFSSCESFSDRMASEEEKAA